MFEIGVPIAFPTSSSTNFDEKLNRKNIREFLPLCITNVEVVQKLKEGFLNFDGEISLYNSTTAIFAPHFIADVRFGIFTKLNLSTHQVTCFIKDNVFFILIVLNN